MIVKRRKIFFLLIILIVVVVFFFGFKSINYYLFYDMERFLKEGEIIF